MINDKWMHQSCKNTFRVQKVEAGGRGEGGNWRGRGKPGTEKPRRERCRVGMGNQSYSKKMSYYI